MKDVVPFHFILLSAGEVLKTETSVHPQKLQNYIASEGMFEGIRPTLNECEMALKLLSDAGFLSEDQGNYSHVNLSVQGEITSSPMIIEKNTEEEKYLNELLSEIDRAKEKGKKTIFRISDKVPDSTIGYVKSYFSANPNPEITTEFKKCQSCTNTWDIIIGLRYP